MSAVGGSIESIGLRGREFAVDAEATANRKLGGSKHEVKMNGNGSTARLIKVAGAWMLTGVEVEIDDNRNDQEYLQDLANELDFFPMSITFASGHTWQGTGQLVEDIELDSQNAIASLSLSGPGRMTQQ